MLSAIAFRGTPQVQDRPTSNHDVTYLPHVLAFAKPVCGIEYTANPVKDARQILLQMRLIGKSARRSRRLVDVDVTRSRLCVPRSG